MPRFDVITLFEPMFSALTEHGISGRAYQKNLYQFKAWNPRTFTSDAHRTVDDRPYGGGPGMVMLAEPLLAAANAVRAESPTTQFVYLTPHGRKINQQIIAELTSATALTLICGRYEAIDERVINVLKPLELSVGDFVVSGGELPAMLLLDAIIRRLPGAVTTAASIDEDSFENGLLDCPHFSRPEVLETDDGLKTVPAVLLSGHHERIAVWRRQQSLRVTLDRRPDLLALAQTLGRLSPIDQAYLAECGYNIGLSSSD